MNDEKKNIGLLIFQSHHQLEKERLACTMEEMYILLVIC